MSEKVVHKPSQKICILLPVLNEISNIGPLLQRIGLALQERDYVICIVDDGSGDGTVDYLHRAMRAKTHRLHLIERVKTVRGSQRGSALFAAMMWALVGTECDLIVEMDGDLSHRPEELVTGLALLEGDIADIVIASKYLYGSKVTNRPIGRRLVSTICNCAVRLLISAQLHDYSNGYRFYKRAAAQAIAETKIVYASPIYLTEAMAIWISRGFRLREIPTHYVGRNEGLSKLRFLDLIKASIAIFEVSFRLHIKGFEKSDCATSRKIAEFLSKRSALP